MEVDFQKNFFISKINTQHSNTLPKYYEGDFDDDFNYNSNKIYSFLLKSELLVFFQNLNIDTPQTLNSIVSYKRTRFKSKLNRLVNYLQRDGKKTKYLLLFLLSYWDNFKTSLVLVNKLNGVCYN